jgi:hypothetical protein
MTLKGVQCNAFWLLQRKQFFFVKIVVVHLTHLVYARVHYVIFAQCIGHSSKILSPEHVQLV